MTTNHVNLQLELKVTDKLLWDLCGYAREKSQNENFWAEYVCQWGIVLFLCWLLMHHKELGLCKKNSALLLHEKCSVAGNLLLCAQQREGGRSLLICPRGTAGSAVCRCKGLHSSHGNMFANGCCLWRCPFHLKVTGWLALSWVPASPHHCWDTHPNRTMLGAAFCCLNVSSMAMAGCAQCCAQRCAEAEAASLSLEPYSDAFLSYWL